jgi:TolA-binding protein
MTFVRVHWKLILIGIAAIVVMVWIGSVTGTNRKLFGALLDQIRVDQSRVVKTLEETLIQREYEIADLQQQVQINERKQSQVRAENERLIGIVNGLQTQRKTIIISGDPDRIVAELRRLGFGSARRGCR